MPFVECSLAMLALVWLSGGCGSGSTSMNTPPAASSQTSAVTLTVTDAPPAGVTLLSFEVTVNGVRKR
jgi:hypothetical protein